ncbi:receptor activity-modifying protein 3 isoform X1 [Gouania willdenowi]|uniref:Receptor activity-modifying protein 3-like n=1 Tax=Gouania willdenowi TaxID=441366 RepID=A0A8C5GSJ3_GOUWI|nr:receptor activity-modifying protein 3-like isoform X1 [Gouania willdenowi]
MRLRLSLDLLLSALLLLGGVELHAADKRNHTFNVSTDGHEEEWSQSKWNQTFNASTNGANDVHESTNATLFQEIQDELNSSQTFDILTEDDESFQDQDMWFPGLHCDQELLLLLSASHCGELFHQEMLWVSSEDWCHLSHVIRQYNDLTMCLERLSHVVGCYFPNPDIQDFLLHIHSIYFHNCTEEEELLLEDAPHGLVIVLTLIPVCIIPLMVYMVVWKSKVAN